MAYDRFQRNIHYLRISLTDMCNLRCVYCMPEDMTFRPREELLQDDELIRLMRVFTGLGFDKFRLTGGEPTLRENLVDLVRDMAAVDGVRELAMTTNAILLKQLAAPLRAAGLQRLNISIDTLNPEKFKRLTRWGRIEDVWAGLEAAKAAGLPIKINAVIVRGQNDREDAVDLARLTLQYPWQVRYIEVMPMGQVADFQKSAIVPEDELRATISEALGPMDLLNEGKLDGEARLFRLRDAPGTLGFISAVTKPFCAGCNRARLTADGRLLLCLLRDKECNLLEPLRAGASDDDLKALIEENVWYKPWGHGLAHDVRPSRNMSEIGG
jgi:GTP 3',8-cyclase